MIRSLCLAAALAAGCATTSTESTTWTNQPEPVNAPMYGQVESVRQVVTTVRGNPTGGAVAGGLIGGLLFHGSVASTLFGAAGGALVGGALSSGGSQTVAYEVYVRFDSGDTGKFTFRDSSPFAPGERVVLTRDGLFRS